MFLPCNKSLCLDTGDKEVLHSTFVWTCRQWLHWDLCWNWWCRQRRMGGGQNGSWGRSWLLRKIKTFQDSGKSNSLTFSCKTDTCLLFILPWDSELLNYSWQIGFSLWFQKICIRHLEWIFSNHFCISLKHGILKRIYIIIFS